MTYNTGGKRAFFYIIPAVVAYLSFLVLRPYFSAIVLALLTVVICKPVYGFFTRFSFKKEKLAVTMSVVFARTPAEHRDRSIPDRDLDHHVPDFVVYLIPDPAQTVCIFPGRQPAQ